MSTNVHSFDIEGKEAFPLANSGLPMPKGHEHFSEADKEKCPVMSGKIKVPTAGDAKSIDLESKEAHPFGGNGLPMPKGHEHFSEADKDKCPVLSGKIKVPTPDADQADAKTDGAKDGTKKKVKKAKGGCPFMPSGKIRAFSLINLNFRQQKASST